MTFYYVEKSIGGKMVKVAENNRTLTFFSLLGILPQDATGKSGVLSHEKAVLKHSRGLEREYSSTTLLREI